MLSIYKKSQAALRLRAKRGVQYWVHILRQGFYEIEHIDVLKEEVFGPVVHVIRYRAEALEEVFCNEQVPVLA